MGPSYDLEEKNYGFSYPSLMTRGWAFQERMFSGRVLHYTHKELVWECQTKAWCQCGFISLRHDFENRIDRNEVQTLKARFHSEMGDANWSTNSQRLWVNVVEEYSRKRLTKVSDRLPALSGLARAFDKIGLGQYCAGIWSKDVGYWLLWHPVFSPSSHTNRRTVSVAPSWSWASLLGGVTFIDWQDRVQ